MAALQINVSQVLAPVFDSPTATMPLLRKLLLQGGLSLADLFLCDKTKGRAVAKNKTQLKEGLLCKYPKAKYGVSKKHKGGMSVSDAGGAAGEQRQGSEPKETDENLSLIHI